MKLQEVEVKKLGQQMVDFVDDVRDLTNNGKFAHPIVGLVPAWTADNGEMVFFDAGEATTDRRIYVRLSSSWVLFAQILGNGAASNPGGPEGAVQYNSGGIFGGEVTALFQTSAKYLVLQSSPLGRYTPLVLANSLAFSAGNDTAGAVRISFGFGNRSNSVVLDAGKLHNYTAGNLRNSYFDILTESGGTLVKQATFGTNDNVGAMGVGMTGVNPIAALVVNGGATIGNNNTLNAPLNGITSRGSIGIGDDPAASLVSADQKLLIETFSNTAEVDLRGQSSVTTPSLVDFGTTDNPAQATIALRKQAIGHMGNSYGGLEVLLGAQSTHVIVFSRDDQLSVTQERPLFRVEASTLRVNTSTIITNQRWSQFIAPHFNTVSVGSSTITNAATVYIDSAPYATNTSVTITNAYALWVDAGDVRFDGALIVGGSTITPTPFVVNTRALFTTTGLGVASNNAGEITLLRGVVGTTGLTANTLSDGRTIRLSALGYFNTPLVVDNLTMRVKVGGQTVLTTGAQTPAASASTLGWKLDTLLTCQTTGGAGTVIGQGDSEFHSSLVAKDFWQMINSSTVVINTTGANAIEITAQWSGVSSASQLFLTNAVGELLN